MNKNPYNMIFGKKPPEMLSRVVQRTNILTSFQEESQQIYMITGVRGSGKTVFMTDIAKSLTKNTAWIVLELSPSQDIPKEIAAGLASENQLAKIFQNARINLSLFGIGLTVKESVPISSIQVALTKMLESLKKHGKRILICIDEVIVTESMKQFASMFQIFVRNDLPVYLLMTGLYENINGLQNEKNLTFLYRAPKIDLKPLNLSLIADNYQKNFNISYEQADEMARLTRGYSFAFQVLGHFTWEYGGDYHKAIPDFRVYLEEYVYDKVWSEMATGDRRFVHGMTSVMSGRAKEIKEYLSLSDGEYSVYRDRLIKRGLINGDEHGVVRFVLPLFEEYVKRHYYI